MVCVTDASFLIRHTLFIHLLKEEVNNFEKIFTCLITGLLLVIITSCTGTNRDDYTTSTFTGEGECWAAEFIVKNTNKTNQTGEKLSNLVLRVTYKQELSDLYDLGSIAYGWEWLHKNDEYVIDEEGEEILETRYPGSTTAKRSLMESRDYEKGYESDYKAQDPQAKEFILETFKPTMEISEFKDTITVIIR